jgi:hypothetical protein
LVTWFPQFDAARAQRLARGILPEALDEFAYLPSPTDRGTALIDGCNVMHGNARGAVRAPDLTHVERAMAALRRLGYRPLVLFGPGVWAKVPPGQEPRLEAMLLSGDAAVAPAGQYDDAYLLRTARRRHYYVVSNDKFRDFRAVPGLGPLLARRHSGVAFVGDAVIFDDCLDPVPRPVGRRS